MSKKNGLDRNGYAPSIMQTEEICYITGTTINLHRHEIFFGSALRELSKKYGCWVYLTGELHNQSNEGVHFNRDLDLKLKKICQIRFESLYGHNKFISTFGKNYL